MTKIMKKILLLLVNFIFIFLAYAQDDIKIVGFPEFFDSHTHERAFVKEYAGNNWFYYFSPIDTVRIQTELSKYYFGFMHNDSIVIAYFVHCGTECYYNFLYVKPTHKHYYLEDVLAIDWNNHILAFIPTMCNTIYFFDYLNNDTVNTLLKIKSIIFFPVI